MTHDSDASEDHTLIGPESHHDFGDRFKVIRWLGRGGMGDVYLAMDNNLHRRVAIKVIRPDLSEDQEIRQRIERECLLHAKVGPHPNIVTLFDKLERGGEMYLIMEYVDGQTLREYIDHHREQRTEPPRSEAFRITMQMLEALARIHAEGIVHRDIKPANVMLTKDDDGEIRAKLMDFGIARLESGGSQFTNMMRTAASSSMGSPGTPLYMAPEQFDSDTFGPVSARTDVYAMGIVLYELLATHPPFGGSLTEILRGHLNSPPPPIKPKSGFPVPAPLASVIQTALAKKPSDRFNSAAAFRDTLVHLSEIESSSLSEMASLPELDSDNRQKAKDDDDDIIAVPAPRHPTPVSAAPPHAPGMSPVLTTKRPPIFARVAVMAAGLLVLLGFVGLLQVLTGSDETAQAGEPTELAQGAATAANGVPTTLDASVTVTSDPASTPAVPPADASVPPAAPADPSPTLDGIAAAQGLYAMETLAQPSAELSADAPGVDPATPLPGNVLTPADQGLTAPAVPPVPEEGFSMGTPNGALPPPGTNDTMPANVNAANALEIVDQGLGQNNEGRIYIVKPGDSLSKIAKETNVDMYDLAIWNELERPNDLQVGQDLYLYERPGIRKVNPQWVTPRKKSAPAPEPENVAAAPEPTPAPAPPPVPVVKEEEKGFIGRFVDKINRKQREKKEELQQTRGR